MSKCPHHNRNTFTIVFTVQGHNIQSTSSKARRKIILVWHNPVGPDQTFYWGLLTITLSCKRVNDFAWKLAILLFLIILPFGKI